MRVKICGITRLEDAQVAVVEGAWALGFIFYRQSPRYVAPDLVRSILTALAQSGASPEKTVGVFVNASVDEIHEVVAISGVNSVQLHGDESPELVRELTAILSSGGQSLDVIKAFRLKSKDDLSKPAPYQNAVTAILCDAAQGEVYGGTGKVADWSLVTQLRSPKPLILAGGLNAANIVSAILATKPYAIDLSSSVESSPGHKDHEKIRGLFAAIRGYDAGSAK
jgi:phosphoribosylanthranilate isomerase